MNDAIQVKLPSSENDAEQDGGGGLLVLGMEVRGVVIFSC